MTSCSESLTWRTWAWLGEHASEASISPGVNERSGTVQERVDLSISAVRQDSADARPVTKINAATQESVRSHEDSLSRSAWSLETDREF